MKQWQTIRYYLLDHGHEKQKLQSLEKRSLEIDIDLSWINDHRKKFLDLGKVTPFSQAVIELKNENTLDSI